MGLFARLTPKFWLDRKRLKAAHLKAIATYFDAKSRGDKRAMGDAWEATNKALRARLQAGV